MCIICILPVQMSGCSYDECNYGPVDRYRWFLFVDYDCIAKEALQTLNRYAIIQKYFVWIINSRPFARSTRAYVFRFSEIRIHCSICQFTGSPALTCSSSMHWPGTDRLQHWPAPALTGSSSIVIRKAKHVATSLNFPLYRHLKHFALIR